MQVSQQVALACKFNTNTNIAKQPLGYPGIRLRVYSTSSQWHETTRQRLLQRAPLRSWRRRNDRYQSVHASVENSTRTLTEDCKMRNAQIRNHVANCGSLWRARFCTHIRQWKTWNGPSSIYNRRVLHVWTSSMYYGQVQRTSCQGMRPISACEHANKPPQFLCILSRSRLCSFANRCCAVVSLFSLSSMEWF